MDVEVTLVHHPLVTVALNPVESALESGLADLERGTTIERALWGTQLRPKIDPVTGLPSAKGRRIPVRGALMADRIRAYQIIGERAASGQDLPTFLRMEALLHEVMQPLKGEAAGGQPRRVFFQDAPGGLGDTKPPDAPTNAEPPPTIVDREGNEYVQP